jgi:hypothetical protein
MITHFSAKARIAANAVSLAFASLSALAATLTLAKH